MREIRIDFTAEEMLPDGNEIGRIGEHNATDLIITPPAEMSGCEEIVSYIAAFVTDGKIIRSESYEKAETITVPLCSQLTQDHTLGVQLEGYDGIGSLVVKSKLVTGLHLMPSAGGDVEEFDCEDGGIVSQINANTLARHSHANKTVLDKLGESDGILTFGGEPAMNTKTKTIELNIDDGEAEVFVEPFNLFFFVCDFSFETPPIPKGSRIISIELNTDVEGADEWVDLRNMVAYDRNSPYMYQNCDAFFDEEFGETCIGMIRFIQTVNEFYRSATRYGISKIRVTFSEPTAV